MILRARVLQQLLALMVVLPTTAYSLTVREHNKTFYALKQPDYTFSQTMTTWHTHTVDAIGNTHGLSMQIVPFGRWSVTPKESGKLLSPQGTSTLTIAPDRGNVYAEEQLPSHSVAHSHTGSEISDPSGTLSLSPGIDQYGATIEFFQDGADIADGLSLTVSIPLVYTRAQLAANSGNNAIDTYLTGTFHSDTQEKLLYGTLGRQTHFSCGPVMISLQYNLVQNSTHFAGIIIGGNLSTGTAREQDTLLTTRSIDSDGNKLHIGLQAGTTVWQTERKKFDLFCECVYHHSLPYTQERVLSVRDDDGSQLAWSAYRQAGRVGHKGVSPVANYTHVPVDLARKNQCNISVMGSYRYQHIVADMGYSLQASQSEYITKVDVTTMPFFSLVSSSYDPSTLFESDNDLHAHNSLVVANDLDRTTATHPAQVAAQLFASIGYSKNNSDGLFPFCAGLGCSYEHAFTSASMSTVSVWAKLGISF